MSKKVLVTYATHAGSTAEVAEAVGQKLAGLGYAVDVLPVAKAVDLSGYQAVVVGAPVRMGQWMASATKFVEEHQQALRQVPVAFFAMHLLNQTDSAADVAAREAILAAARKLVPPAKEAIFLGVGDPAKVSLIERLMFKAVKSPEGDFRDWNAIEAWAESLGAVFS